MNESEVQQAQINKEHHLLNFLRAMFAGNDPALGRFRATERMAIYDPAVDKERVAEITDCGVHQCSHYLLMLKLMYGGEENLLQAMGQFFEEHPGTQRRWQSPVMKDKWEQVYNLDYEMSLQTGIEARAAHEMYVAIQELGVWCFAPKVSFQYFQWSHSEEKYVSTSLPVIRHYVNQAVYARVGDENVVKNTLRDLDTFIIQLRQVEGVNRLAGFNAGLNVTPDDTKLLCPKGPSRKIEPKEGDFELVYDYLKSRFCEEQMPYIVGWLSQCVKKLYAVDRHERDYLTHAALFLGDAGVGKSSFQEKFLTPLFWGRHSDFAKELVNPSDFNASRANCEHLLVGDFALGNLSAERVSDRITGTIKAITANGSYSLRAMFSDAVTVKNMNILTISTNLDPKNIRVWPDLDDASVEGKMHMFLMEDTGHKFLVGQWGDMIGQLPGFIYHLLHLDVGYDQGANWYIDGQEPTIRLDPRFGVGSYIHPLARELRQDVKDQDSKLEYDDMALRSMGKFLEWLESVTDWLERGISIDLMHAIIRQEVEIPGVSSDQHQQGVASLALIRYIDVTKAGRGKLSLPGLVYTFAKLSDRYNSKQRTLNRDLDYVRTRGIGCIS